MKNGGADVRVLDSAEINPNGEDWRGKLLDAARKISGQGTDDDPLVGYFVVGMFGRGTTSTGFRYDPQRCPIPRALMPAWVEEVVRRDLVTAQEAVDIVNEANGF